MKEIEHLINGLPDPEAAKRFLDQLSQKSAAQGARLLKDSGLLADVLALVSFSPLIAATLLQHPDHLWWLARKRHDSGVRSKDEMLESLAQFMMTNSQVEAHDLYARFRRRELLRIYLRDIRRLGTIAEITEEISNVADAILESALKLARNEMDGRYGQPQETDAKGRLRTARFCIGGLGKLGSRELNYSSDIDLLFLYSAEGETTGRGSRGKVTNREYFIKLAELTIKIVGERTGEGGAYRVDLRLRPHGTLGALALSVEDAVKYHNAEARPWERQVMIRSRGCAGDIDLFRAFCSRIEELIFSSTESVESALRNVRLSKEKIDLENVNKRGFDVKLGRGGIREIEFLAQALQLAYGGKDPWLRSSHTLISLSRLADRGLIARAELTSLATAYEFLRRTEHVLQMENGLQTHSIPDDPDRRNLLARRVTFASGGDFEQLLLENTGGVSTIFHRVFGDQAAKPVKPVAAMLPGERNRNYLRASIVKSDVSTQPNNAESALIDHIASVSPHFSSMIAANPHLLARLPDPNTPIEITEYFGRMRQAANSSGDLGTRLSAMRRTWSSQLLEIVIRDVYGTIGIGDAKRLQTDLAEATLAAALEIVRDELAAKYSVSDDLPLAVLALGKLGGRGLDYDSDLDLILVYDDRKPVPDGVSQPEYYSRAAEILVNTISSMTRDGSLYRIDLRLRPYGSKGSVAIASGPFLEYMGETAAVWEMLAFVKLRAVGGDLNLGRGLESETRSIIHERASQLSNEDLKAETRRIRDALEEQRSRGLRQREIDLKYGEGGMLDIYFAMRYLQLAKNIPDDPENRSTSFMLEKIREAGAIERETFADLADGYNFLSSLDHQIRLTIGRTTRVPLANRTAMAVIAERMSISSLSELVEKLTFHRLAIRSAFEQILS
jgi:glutamate-ammonia-ligase adenylyltransferase